MSSMTERKNEAIKVLLITHYYAEHRGGVEIVAGKLAEGLAQREKLKVVWLSSSICLPSISEKIKCVPIFAFNWIENRIHIPYPILTISSFKTLLNEVRAADVIHIHDYLYMSNIIAFCLSKLYGKKLIVTQHIGFIPYDSVLFRSLLSLLNRTLGKLILKNADQVVFISETVQTYFTSSIRFNPKPLMIPNGVDTRTFFSVEDSQRREIRRKLNLDPNRFVFLFVGRFVEKKGLLLLQKLASHFRAAHWLFAGWGPLNPNQWELPNVRVFKGFREAQLSPLYQAADLLVLPSKGEGFPLVVQESMACGTPVVVGAETAKACSAARHLILSEDVDGETVDVAKRWVEKIDSLVCKPSALSELRPQVSDFARRYWSWQNCSQEYYRVINNQI